MLCIVPSSRVSLAISYLRCELANGHADIVQDAPQRALRHVAVAVHRHRGAAPVGVAHDVVLPLTRATLKPWRSNARTTLMPETDGSGGIRPPQ